MIIPSLPFHTVLAGSRLYFHPSRSNLFADASDSELHRIMAPSTTLRPAYRLINPLNNHRNIGVWVDYLLPKSDFRRTILLCLAHELIPKLLERATLPLFPTAAVLLLPMLMLDLNLHAKVIHTQNVGNGIGLMVTQSVNGVTDA